MIILAIKCEIDEFSGNRKLADYNFAYIVWKYGEK